MDINEYSKVKRLKYLEYCDYLQDKYGIGLDNYYTENFVKSPKVSRTSEGLFAHHKYEYKVPLLCSKSAKRLPYEYQLAENIVYCDWLEHLLLHLMICEEHDNLSWGGMSYLIPILNDIYIGVRPDNVPKNRWQFNCIDRIADDIDVYVRLFNRYAVFLDLCPEENKFEIESESLIYWGKAKKNMDTLYWLKNYGYKEYEFRNKLIEILYANHFCEKCNCWIGNHKTLEVPSDDYNQKVQSIASRRYCNNCHKK